MPDYTLPNGDYVPISTIRSIAMQELAELLKQPKESEIRFINNELVKTFTDAFRTCDSQDWQDISTMVFAGLEGIEALAEHHGNIFKPLGKEAIAVIVQGIAYILEEPVARIGLIENYDKARGVLDKIYHDTDLKDLISDDVIDLIEERTPQQIALYAPYPVAKP